jgi:hypothetical protein
LPPQIRRRADLRDLQIARRAEAREGRRHVFEVSLGGS